MEKNKTFTIALGGVLTGLTVVFVYISSIMPGLELTMYAISSLFVAVMVVESGTRGGVLVFLASAIVSFVLIPVKTAFIPYIALFGYYGIIKLYIEKINNQVLEIIIKLAIFIVIFGGGTFIFGEVFLGNIQLPDQSVPVLVLAGVIGFLLYDRIYSGIIELYISKIRRKIIK